MPELIIPPEAVRFYMPMIYLAASIFIISCILLVAYILGDIADEMD